jgi:hypothetical protein
MSVSDFKTMIQKIVVIAAGCANKEVEELNDQEKLAMALVAGCEYEFTGTGLRLKNPVGFQKINGQFRVCERRS